MKTLLCSNLVLAYPITHPLHLQLSAEPLQPPPHLSPLPLPSFVLSQASPFSMHSLTGHQTARKTRAILQLFSHFREVFMPFSVFTGLFRLRGSIYIYKQVLSTSWNTCQGTSDCTSCKESLNRKEKLFHLHSVIIASTGHGKMIWLYINPINPQSKLISKIHAQHQTTEK